MIRVSFSIEGRDEELKSELRKVRGKPVKRGKETEESGS